MAEAKKDTKVTFVKQPDLRVEEPVITLELTPIEAQVILAVIGQYSGDDSPAGNAPYSIYNALYGVVEFEQWDVTVKGKSVRGSANG